ncbi:MAG: DNA repair ATPase, partial [Planctomycetota bacterium]
MTDPILAGGTYEVLRSRLRSAANDLDDRLNTLNDQRNEVFGNVPTKLIDTCRVTTDHNCIPRDLVAIGGQFLLGYNVQFGLKTEITLPDVFAAYQFADHQFHRQPLTVIEDQRFAEDFAELYRFYKGTTFSRFFLQGPMLHMVFQVGKTARDIKSFKWRMTADSLEYLDNRSDHEVRLPAQHAFDWVRATRDMHRYGDHPHISIDDRVFVETVGGDLTIKIEDNTADGSGVYREPVDNPDQKLDDADIAYSIVGNLVLLRIKPYQESQARYIVFNGKLNQAVRLDEMQHACVMLPGDQGIIFPGGYYLQTGEFKRFDHGLTDMRFERTVGSPNGEDYLFLFSNAEHGTSVQLRYNQIRQTVDTPLVCHGQTLFDDGQMICFKAESAPQKHHAIQVWQTPFNSKDFAADAPSDSYLAKIGNRELVTAMAECAELRQLIDKDDSYDGLYVDLVKKSGDILDSYFWINNDQTGRLDVPLSQIQDAASMAVEEYDKVVRVRDETNRRTTEVQRAITDTISEVDRRRFESIEDFVAVLADLRRHRGHAIGLKELKYADESLADALEAKVAEQSDRISHRCVEFLLRDEALASYVDRIASIQQSTETMETVRDAGELQASIDDLAGELELLTETVSNLPIDDTTKRTAIIDSISDVLSDVNRVRSGLTTRRRELVGIEGRAEFASQMKLLQQTTAGFLDVCDTPTKCDDYLTKVMVQLEELEGRFAEFDEFIEQLAARRDDVYTAFESRKVSLVEKQNQRAEALSSAADRILKGIASRVGAMSSTDDIAAYFAGDMMVQKARDLIAQLQQMGDAVRVGDLQGRLKVIREDATRSLQDRLELFEGDGDVIRLGERRFAVNHQPLDLTTVLRDDQMCLHVTGTQYFEPINDARLTTAHDLWSQPLLSENESVYRGEYLAMELFVGRFDTEIPHPVTAEWVQTRMAGRLSEGYAKGVHDADTALILNGLVELDQSIGLLRFSPSLRVAAMLLWYGIVDSTTTAALGKWLTGISKLAKRYPDAGRDDDFARQLYEAIEPSFSRVTSLFGAELLIDDVVDYLLQQWTHSANGCCISAATIRLHERFQQTISSTDRQRLLATGLKATSDNLERMFVLARGWADGFLRNQDADDDDPDPARGYCDELAWLLMHEVLTTNGGKGHTKSKPVMPMIETVDSPVAVTLQGLVGDHRRIQSGQLSLHYHEFMSRVGRYRRDLVPRFEQLQTAKSQVLEETREAMRLDEFKPRVLSSFVRNRLLDEVYLPMIGDNLAKQMGTAGEDKRTDRMGLLLLISPPGYGKTTLMEYIANRLGLVFMKINGPAIGHGVTSLDPAEAPNAAAREEVERLNLALEMGDNVMLYLDDIQHTHPELLQKFISLCDATRKIEGVRDGKTRTYDLRGRRVAVVMAGNPYTESGDRFQIPDMLSNRADVYNLGEIIGDKAEAFEVSYLENCLTSNPTLAPLATASPSDARLLIQAAMRDSMESVDLNSKWPLDQVRDMFEVLRKLLRVRDVVLRVNRAYIQSAAQADAYRTEPPFKLQGSYRNMNRIAERVAPVMNDTELQTLIVSNYEQDSQTLTTDNEANVLKFKELLGTLSSDELARWDSIKYAYVENVRMSGMSNEDQAGQFMRQLASMRDGLESIRATIAKAVAAEDQSSDIKMDARVETLRQSVAAMGNHLAEQLERASQQLQTIAQQNADAAEAPPLDQRVLVQHKVPRVIADLVKGQFHLMQEW